VPTFEELDKPSSQELHDRAIKRAEHRLDAGDERDVRFASSQFADALHE